MPRYLPEPAYRHGSPALTAVLLINLGTPVAPNAQALRAYLRNSFPTRASSRSRAPSGG
jgi:ferrochelatase